MFIFLLLSFFLIAFSATAQIQGTVTDTSGNPLPHVSVLLEETGAYAETDQKGFFQLEQVVAGTYQLLLFKENYISLREVIQVQAGTPLVLNLRLGAFEKELEEIDYSLDEGRSGWRRLRAVEGMAIYASKKAEVIELDNISANLATNNAREVYAKIAGLNIWENDNSGIQLNIGGRGLSPNRSSNFNTRQNGYDISADALGYPESYYTPPTQAVKRIEVVRGAASLQYGTQFGGMLNFELRDGRGSGPLEVCSENTYGSFNFFNTFNSIAGEKGKFNYYTFYQYKRGDGWRPNAGFGLHAAHAHLAYQVTKKLRIAAEYTLTDYRAQQPGGLTDLEFRQDPRQSKRERNWFGINWNLFALDLDYAFSKRTHLNLRGFGLLAGRQALGNLRPINRPDYGEERDLIKGAYRNIGAELRVKHQYQAFKLPSTLLVGGRIYRGFATQQQGLSNAGSTGTAADFQFLDPQMLASDYQFPSVNASLFAENYMPISEKISITPGIRYEYISTQAEGYYQDLLAVQGTMGLDTLRNEQLTEQRRSDRSVLLLGLGGSYRPTNDIELYANISQNYRAINFNDMRIVNPNAGVDPDLRDERGYNADLGFRGVLAKGNIKFDATLFYLRYNDRIGNIESERPNPYNPLIIEPFTLRTNVGDARIYGLESLIEVDILRLIRGAQSAPSLVWFSNFSFLNGRYLSTENTFAAGNEVEFVPPTMFKTGLTFSWKNLRLSYQFARTAAHYTDATNTVEVPNAVIGIIPAYQVMDCSAAYTWKKLRVQAGINNVADARYFTRRAAAYPGPGIIPAAGRSFYLSLRYKWAK